VTTATSAPARTGRTAPVRPWRLLVGALVVALVALVLVLWTGDGRPAPAPPGIPDPGPGTEWALPSLRVAADLAAVLTVGLLLAGAVLVPARDGVLTGARLRWTRAARWAALAWAIASAAEILLSLSDVLAQPLSGVLDPTLVWSFVRDIGVGRSLLVQAGLALVVALSAYAIRSTTGALLVLLVALVALVLPTVTSHAGTSADHSAAVTTLMVHVVAVSLWCGGLVALVLLGTSDRRPLPVAVPRFSALALWCAIGVAASGALSAWIRMSGLADLVTTSYGRIVLLKVALTVAIACFGVYHRRRHLTRLSSDATRLQFLRVAAVEVLVMAATVGVAVALSRTPPPVSGDVPLDSLSPARLVLGFDLPPSPTLAGLLWGQARIDGYWLAVIALMIGLYASGLRSLRKRGVAWSKGRTANWYVGVALLAVATCSGLDTYGHVTFSAHMFQHMVLAMLVPVFLVLGAPLTLALEVLPARSDQRGPREWIETVLASRALRAFANPLVASLLFLFGFYGLYFTPLFPWFMGSHFGHLLMNTFFLLTGALFYWTLIGIDPGPKRPPHLVGMVIMIVVMAFHSMFAVELTLSSTVIAEEFYTSLQRPWLTDLLADQHLGANIGWASGDIPMALVMAAVFVQWVRSDEQDARRADSRQDAADATGEGVDELADYNAYLARLAERDKRQT
jgi:cytochrome c oxidase assembly factor CtaG/putative copper export protein